MKYEILGEPLPVVVCHLEGGESMITERGSMVWMSPNMKMETGAGGIGKAFGRMFSGDSIFQNTYTAQGGPGMIAFGSSFPGSIRAIEVDPAHPVVVQKSGFLASEQGVELSIFFQKPACSAARASSCRSCPATVPPLWSWTALRWSTSSRPERAWLSTAATWP